MTASLSDIGSRLTDATANYIAASKRATQEHIKLREMTERLEAFPALELESQKRDASLASKAQQLAAGEYLRAVNDARTAGLTVSELPSLSDQA